MEPSTPGVTLYEDYRHHRTQRVYRPWALTEMQLPDGDWVPGVIYTPVGLTKNYTRPVDVFLAKFERIL